MLDERAAAHPDRPWLKQRAPNHGPWRQVTYGEGAQMSGGARAFLDVARASSPFALGAVKVSRHTLHELEAAHHSLIAMHLEKDLKSVRVLREMRR